MTVRLAVFRDYAAEGWPSMDLCADMFLGHLPATAPDMAATDVCPPFRRRFVRFPGGRNADRLINRLWYYPRHARRIASEFDLFHIVDHSYSQLLHALPSGRVGVYCHDLDTFRCLLEPDREPRRAWFRAMVRRILHGFQKAAVVFYSTAAVRRQIEAHGLIDSTRLVCAPNGVAPEFTPDPRPEDVARMPNFAGPFLLHVGSCIPRKRVDVLLELFAAARARRPNLTLVQVGSKWTGAQQEQIDRLGLAAAIQQARGIGRRDLAALYRRAALVLLPSEAEGFGLPVVEALACGAGVVASDIPVLREVGGDAAIFCRVGDVTEWAETVSRLLDDPAKLPSRSLRLSWSGRFSWAAQAATIAGAYRCLLETGLPTVQ